MADLKISQLTAKGTALAATDLLEISESDGAGGYVTKSVTGANVKSGLQATLVSGTNIKTINSTSLLGSGDLVVGLTTPANLIILYPFIPANTLTVSSLQINVTSATASSLIRILVYSDLNGVPSSKLLESTSLDCSTTGAKTYTASLTFTAGTVYWLGYYANTFPSSLSAVPGVELTPISGLAGSFGAANITVTASTTFGSAPSTLGTATPALNSALHINLISA